MFTSHIHQKRKPRRPLPERIARANTRRSKIRAQVEHMFAGQKHRMGLVVRTIGIARATIKIGMANLVYNFQRLAGLERPTRADLNQPEGGRTRQGLIQFDALLHHSTRAANVPTIIPTPDKCMLNRPA